MAFLLSHWMHGLTRGFLVMAPMGYLAPCFAGAGVRRAGATRASGVA
jgi:hypothetical protein